MQFHQLGIRGPPPIEEKPALRATGITTGSGVGVFVSGDRFSRELWAASKRGDRRAREAARRQIGESSY